MIKGIIKFLLTTGTGKLIIGTLLDLLVKKVRDKIKNRPRDHQEIINTTVAMVADELREEIPKELIKKL